MLHTLRRLLVVLAAVVAVTVPLTAPASAIGNDYPYRYDTTWSADPWGFTKRQCVSFVAWRMKQRGIPMSNYRTRWGSALTWDDTARRIGVRIGTRPVPGAIAHWNAYESSPWYANGATRPNGTVRAGGYGHVGYVQGVYPDGSVSVAQYNMSGTRSYSTMRVRAPRYLYYGVRAPL